PRMGSDHLDRPVNLGYLHLSLKAGTSREYDIFSELLSCELAHLRSDRGQFYSYLIHPCIDAPRYQRIPSYAHPRLARADPAHDLSEVAHTVRNLTEFELPTGFGGWCTYVRPGGRHHILQLLLPALLFPGREIDHHRVGRRIEIHSAELPGVI